MSPVILTFVPSVVFAAAGAALILGVLAWRRRRDRAVVMGEQYRGAHRKPRWRDSPNYAPWWAYALFFLLLIAVTACGLTLMAGQVIAGKASELRRPSRLPVAIEEGR